MKNYMENQKVTQIFLKMLFILFPAISNSPKGYFLKNAWYKVAKRFWCNGQRSEMVNKLEKQMVADMRSSSGTYVIEKHEYGRACSFNFINI